MRSRPVAGAGGSRSRVRYAAGLTLKALIVLLATATTPQPAGAQPPTQSDPRVIDHGPRRRPMVALTFDADMSPAMAREVAAGRATFFDRRILRRLRLTGTPATIFMTGLWAQVHPEAAASIAHDPLFEIGNHSWRHLAFSTPCYGLPAATSDAERRQEVVKGRALIERITGVRSHWFRFPGGCYSPSDVDLVRSLGQSPVQWDVISGDPGQPEASVVAHTVLSLVRPGSIVVMHLVGAPNAPATYDALATIIPGLRQRGYQLVTLSQLLPGKAAVQTSKLDCTDLVIEIRCQY